MGHNTILVIYTWDDDGPAVHVMATDTARRARLVLRLVRFASHLANGGNISRGDRDFMRQLRAALLSFLAQHLAPSAETTHETKIITISL